MCSVVLIQQSMKYSVLSGLMQLVSVVRRQLKEPKAEMFLLLLPTLYLLNLFVCSVISKIGLFVCFKVCLYRKYFSCIFQLLSFSRQSTVHTVFHLHCMCLTVILNAFLHFKSISSFYMCNWLDWVQPHWSSEVTVLTVQTLSHPAGISILIPFNGPCNTNQFSVDKHSIFHLKTFNNRELEN